MARVRCPKCATVVEVPPGETPVCPTCGFGRETATTPSSPVPSAPAATMPAAPPGPAPTAPAADPWGEGESGAPAAPGAAQVADGHGPPGTVREPAIIVLLYIVTLGIYGLVWHWMTGVEVDRFRPETRASGVLKGYVWTSIAAAVAVIVGMIMVFGAIFGALSDAGEDPADEDVFDAILGAGAGFVVVLLAVAASIAAEVLRLIGMWRIWNMTAEQQQRIGVQPLNPTMLLLFLLSPWALQLIQFALSVTPLVLITPFLGIGVVVLLILAYVWTQNGLNQVWRSYGAR